MDICFTNLTHCYGDTTALDDLSFGVPSGSFVAIVGPSHAGKTTLLRLVAGDEVSTTGTVRFMARNTESSAELETVSPLFLDATSPVVGKQLPPADTGVVILDELSEDIVCTPLERQTYLEKLRSHVRGSIVYATRNEGDALAVSDHLAVLRNGHLQQFGTPKEILADPTNEFVAAYFGRPVINLLPAILEKDGQAILVGNQTMSLAGRIAEEFCRDITVGIRPENVRVTRDAGGWRGRVVSEEADGHYTIVTVNVEGVSIRVRSTESFLENESVFVRLMSRHCIVFDDRGQLLDQL